MRAAALSVARVVRPRAGLACRGRVMPFPVRRVSRTSFRASSSASSVSVSDADGEHVSGHDARVRRLPRERTAHGPTYVFGGTTRLRFLAFHGCASRFTVLFRHGVGVGFDAGELELDGTCEFEKRVNHGWRVRTAAGPPEGVRVESLAGFDGEQIKRLALYDADFGDMRLYQENGKEWSATAAAPTWPKRLCQTLDANGGASGNDALVVVDGGYFLELARLSAFPNPVLFPHGAWRVPNLGPGAPTFHDLASAMADEKKDTPMAAAAALRVAARGAGSKKEVASAPGRVTGEIPGRGRCTLGDASGDAGLAEALDAVSDRTVRVVFPDGPIGMGFAPYDWDLATGAQVMEVDNGSIASRNGVTPGMTFRSVATGNKTIASCVNFAFEEIDRMFDEPRPITVELQSKPPSVERLYAVEMRARDFAAGALATNKKINKKFEFIEPGLGLPSVVWRETHSTIFVGDPGSGTPPHHDIVGQIELCHVITGAKLLAAAPWGEASDELCRRARPILSDDDGDEEDDESSLSVPTHRALSRQEISILETPGLCVVHARPGDVVAFSSAATHFAVNGNAKPCAACFHGVLTPGT
jgi:hypothetical protein